ncbi:hypothetical protein [Janthinobacterium sp. 17J80-10]|uniref:hypothetical protein n=1 Tax=Janthinobacterium sp. 17J80-10 TaxID=2497863 RepID=UPI0010054276|nr:hypothetical protein [Janthinobacterium sp. 17J80-10]QAU35506.1 hypothetical protein EKL02_15785 [Janthinobacterium sp. 17J80-10]
MKPSLYTRRCAVVFALLAYWTGTPCAALDAAADQKSMGADGTVLVDVPLAEEAKVLRLKLPPGTYAFYCAKRLLGFKSHRQRGMAGVLEARE